MENKSANYVDLKTVVNESVIHMNDPRMDMILEKLADLNLPINVHAGDPKWTYEKMDSNNDLLFEAYYC